MERVEKVLEKRAQRGNLRELSSPANLIDFASNDYLGLAKEVNSGSAGSTGSRLLTGNFGAADLLEQELAYLHGYEEALLFGCGYLANLGLLSALGELDGSVILYDAAIHASTRDGISLSRCTSYPFKHNNLDHLEWRLKKINQAGVFICVESIYSMSGEISKLKEICSLAAKYAAHLIVDEAHALGVVGPSGLGLVAHHQLQKQVFAQVITFGKGAGAYGAAVLGKRQLKSFLLNFARSCIYTTALPPHQIASIKNGYKQLLSMDKQRAYLQELCTLLGFSQTPIQPFYIRGNSEVSKAAALLAKEGFDVRALKSPTTQNGQELLRIVLHSFNSISEVTRLKEVLKKW